MYEENDRSEASYLFRIVCICESGRGHHAPSVKILVFRFEIRKAPKVRSQSRRVVGPYMWTALGKSHSHEILY